MVEPRPLLIFPCNGNGREALDCLGDRHRCIGFVDDTPEKQGRDVHGHRVFGRAALREHGDAAVLAVPGSPLSYRERQGIIEALGVDRERFARVVHPGARIAAEAVLGSNVLVMAGAVITCNAVVGDHVLILPNAVLVHDVVIGAFSIVGANVTIGGHTRVGASCYIGGGASIMNGLTIGDGALIGLGSVVIRDVPAGARVAGNPARVLAP
jgi:sugar O-acyltransferase (sialic acid O-acetyltransferase NeuD family)